MCVIHTHIYFLALLTERAQEQQYSDSNEHTQHTDFGSRNNCPLKGTRMTGRESIIFWF